MTPVLQLSHLTFAYEKRAVLQDVTFSIEPGEFVGIIGPNGGGKTTLLKLMMGFLHPTKGEIKLFGHSLKKSDKTRIGYVPQITRLDKQFPITVLEVVLMGMLTELTLWGTWKKGVKKKAEETLDRVGLLSFKDAPFGSLSGGQAQRALIARALIGNPEILFLDEPTASIDPQAEKEIISLLVEIKKESTLIVVTHDFDLISKHVKKVLYVSGKVTVTSSSELCGHYSLGIYHHPLKL